MSLIEEPWTGQIIGAAIEVHRELGPWLLGSAYEECLCREMQLNGLRFDRQVPIQLSYKGVKLDCGSRMDVVVEDQVLVELKCVDRVRSATAFVHEDVAQQTWPIDQLPRSSCNRGVVRRLL